MSQYIYGKNVVISRLKKDKDIEVLYLLKDLKEDPIISKLVDKDLKIEIISKNKMDKLVNTSYNQGYVAKIKEYKTIELDELLSKIKDKEKPLLLMLDGIKDPHNMGAIIRTSDAVGVDGIIISSKNSAPLNSTVFKTSTGAIDYVNIAMVSNLNGAVRKLKEKGYWVVGAEAFNSKDYRELDYDFKTLLVMGSEGEGISPLLLKNCDYLVKIPMNGSVNSLNVSVATALILYQIHDKKFPR